MTIKTLAIAGSLRKESYNQKLVELAARQAQDTGSETLSLKLTDFPMPLLNEDDEAAQGAPAAASQLREHFVNSDLLLIASPEYNGSISGVLKNTIDWLSRPSSSKDGELSSAFEGKVVALLSASPGGFGGMRGLEHLRTILTNLGAIVLPGNVSIPAAYAAFKDDGSLEQEALNDRLKGQIEKAVATAKALK